MLPLRTWQHVLLEHLVLPLGATHVPGVLRANLLAGVDWSRPCSGFAQVHGQKEAALARVAAVEKQKQDLAARNEELRWVILLQPYTLRCGTRPAWYICCRWHLPLRLKDHP